jgi:thioredoxin reductase (NADPH)
MSHHPVLIIGSGPAGYTAALYTSRAGLKPLVLAGFMAGGQAGGQLMTTTEVENFPGFPEGIQGPDLMGRLREQVKRFGAELKDVDVVKVDFAVRPFKIWTDEAEFTADAVIIATGATAKKLNTEPEKRFWNRGASACATCDGSLPIFRNKPIVVIGGGDTALEEANYLTRFGSEVILVHRRNEFRASEIMVQRTKDNPKIRIKTPYVLEDTAGGKLLEKVVLKNTATGTVEEIPANGLFIAIGHEPNTALFKDWIDLDETGYVKTDGHTRTKIPGVFAAGDCVDKIYRQAITAAGQGCMAALQAERWLETQAHSS